MTPDRLDRRAARLVCLAAGASTLVGSACAPPDSGRPDRQAADYLAIVAAEDARPAGGPALAVLLSATRSPDRLLRQAGVRALGRLEDPALADSVVAALGDSDPTVRAEAANALAQSVHGRDGAPMLVPLLRRLEVESDPAVIGVLARSLGRLTVPEAERRRVSRALVALAADAPPEQVLGVVLGLESLARLAGRGSTLDPDVAERLVEMTRFGLLERGQTQTLGRIRSLALMALHAGGRLTVFQVEAALRDPLAPVRWVAAARMDVVPSATRPELVRRALLDPSARVRTEAVRSLAAEPRDAVTCERLITVATRDEDTGVRLLALDALAVPCPDRAEQVAALVGAVSTLGPADALDWHAAARALVSLSSLDAALAQEFLPRLVGHPGAFVRAWAARAAARLGRDDVLRALLEDPSPNVRTVAARTLDGLVGPGADAQLTSLLANASDPQLILTLADLLADTEARDEATAAALAALERLTGARSLTHRDARVALLGLVGDLGGADRVSEVEPYLRDFDPEVARAAAGVLLGWTGDRWIAAPRASPRLSLPTPGQLRAMERSEVVLHMARGGEIRVALAPWVALTNAFRFYTMASEGRLDGLTFHRWVPNFVIQGGSPGANEYAGHGAYTRDEVGLPVHWRGTVGVSTRGRDTGDGQIFVNLVDNVRLDHAYTVFGRVLAGLDVVDGVLEGDVILRAEVRTEP